MHCDLIFTSLNW